MDFYADLIYNNKIIKKNSRYTPSLVKDLSDLQALRSSKMSIGGCQRYVHVAVGT